METLHGQMVIDMKAIGIKVLLMAMEHLSGPVVINIPENGQKVSSMDLVHLARVTGNHTPVIIALVRKMGKALIDIMMALNKEVIGQRISL
jgi:hypothetical protein